MATTEKIYSAVDNIITAFRKYYSNLYNNKILDIETDITAFQMIMQQDGLIDIINKK